MIVLISGGARSGKSSFAEKIAWHQGGKDVCYLATAEIKDQEMKNRVEKHIQHRPQAWETIEESHEVSEVLTHLTSGSVILLDCITVYISNLLLSGNKIDNIDSKQKETEIKSELEKIIKVVKENSLDIIIVTNEVGQGIIPDNKLGRIYRDIVGRMNQYLASEADKVYITFAGLPVEIKDIGVKNLNKYKQSEQ